MRRCFQGAQGTHRSWMSFSCALSKHIFDCQDWVGAHVAEGGEDRMEIEPLRNHGADRPCGGHLGLDLVGKGRDLQRSSHDPRSLR